MNPDNTIEDLKLNSMIAALERVRPLLRKHSETFDTANFKVTLTKPRYDHEYDPVEARNSCGGFRCEAQVTLTAKFHC